MPAVGNHGLRVEEVAADELCDGHSQVRVQADASNSDARIVLVLGGEVDVVMVVVVVVMVTTGSARLSSCGHNG